MKSLHLTKDFNQDTDEDSNCNEQVSRADSKECRNDGLASQCGRVKDTCRPHTSADLLGHWPLDTLGPSGTCNAIGT